MDMPSNMHFKIEQQWENIKVAQSEWKKWQQSLLAIDVPWLLFIDKTSEQHFLHLMLWAQLVQAMCLWVISKCKVKLNQCDMCNELEWSLAFHVVEDSSIAQTVNLNKYIYFQSTLARFVNKYLDIHCPYSDSNMT